jgi:LmbE family N-acetylglucosaminyl deacetylase
MSRSPATSALDRGLPIIRGQGTAERDWQAWSGLARIKTGDADALVSPSQRAIILSPHPDDEVLATGGLLATLATIGREIVVIGVSDGGASHPGSTRWTPTQLAAHRRHESEAGLQQLGVRNPAIRLGLPDGELAHHQSQLIDALHEHVWPTDVVFAPWRHDGHPDHEAVSQAAITLCKHTRATLIEVPIWTWHWARPGDSRVPWQRALRLPLSGDSRRCKQAAIRLHGSQLESDESTGAAPVLPHWALQRWIRPYEVFFTP